MEKSKMQIFSRSFTIYHIMPYYAHTHQAFLLLSTLCSASRKKLVKNYTEFIYLMRENWVSISRRPNTEYFPLPPDLFIIRISEITEQKLDAFIEFVNNLKESQFYFSKIPMNSQIKVDSLISISISLYPKLHPYIEALKSILVRKSDNLDEPISLDTVCNGFKYSGCLL